jgi:hypothetical protein
MYAAESTNHRRLVEALQKRSGPLVEARHVLQRSGIALRRTEPG